MTAVQVTAIVLWLGLTAYAVFGGADFGAGFWDLAAGGTRRGARARALIADAIGPVWEANHTWLIFDLVILWTAFPPAFAAIMSTLFVPLTLAALGIVLRGAAFAFRPVAAGPAHGVPRMPSSRSRRSSRRSSWARPAGRSPAAGSRRATPRATPGPAG